jgi:hypothetical protein
VNQFGGGGKSHPLFCLWNEMKTESQSQSQLLLQDAELLASTTSTSGISLNTQKPWLANAVELLSSMRFAISLLCFIAIASVIGTVLKQNEPMNNYVNQFGPFWSILLGGFC